MKKIRRASMIAVTLMALAGSAASAQGTAHNNTAPEVRQTAPVLATEASSRVGVSRARASSPAAAAQMTDNETTKWIIIIAVAALAAALIIAVAD